MRTLVEMNAWAIASAFIAVLLLQPHHSKAGDEASTASGNKGVTKQIEDTAEKVGQKIEQGVNKAAEKIDAKKIGDKIEKKLNAGANKTEDAFQKAGKKIDQKLEK